MQMFSKDGQTMVDVKRMFVKNGQIAMTAKLMGAYSMTIFLPPEELRASLPLITYELVKAIPDMLVTGTKGEEQLREIGSKLGSLNSANIKALLGEETVQRMKVATETMGINTAETLFNAVMALLPVIFESKPKEEPAEPAAK